MTGALYLFVREGVARDVSPRQRGSLASQPSTPSPEEEEAVITMGEGGGEKVFPYWLYASISVEEYTFNEVSRQTTTKRVENPTDSSQYVDVEQVDKLKVVNANNPKDKRTIVLDNKQKK